MVKKKRRTIDPDGKRKAVLDAAAAELAAKGYAGANTGDIAKRAGVAAGTVFRIYPTKDALANAVYQRAYERYRGLFPATLAPDATPRQQFAAMWKSMADFYSEYPDDFVFYEVHLHDAFLDEGNRKARKDFRMGVIDWIQRMQAAGKVRKMSPDVARALVIGSFARLVREHLNGNVVVTPALLAEAEEQCWRAIAES